MRLSKGSELAYTVSRIPGARDVQNHFVQDQIAELTHLHNIAPNRPVVWSVAHLFPHRDTSELER